MAPGQVLTIDLPATAASFTGWVAHAEVGGGGEGSGGEGSESGGEGGGTGAEAGEAAMSSPITPLGQSWNGVLGGLAVSARYDAATQSVHATVRNTLSQKLCYVQTEPHLKSGTQTVGELGPDKLGDLNPGQQATSSLAVASEPKLAGVSYDGYVLHLEVFDCGGPGPVAHTGTEGSGGESGGSEEGSSGANTLAPNETFDMVRGGARLILSYDAASNSFKGTVEEHDQQRPDPCQDRGAPIERNGAWPDGAGGYGAGPGVDDRPACDGGIVHRMDSTCRGWRWSEGSESGGEGGGEHGSGGESGGGEHGSGGERRGGG